MALLMTSKGFKRAMRMVFPDLPYNEACLKANLPKLSKRRNMLSQNLFDNIAKNKDHKLAHLLPPKTAHTKNLEHLERSKSQHVGQTVLRTPL